MGNWEDEFRMVAAQRGYGLRQCHFDILSSKWEVLLDDGSERGLEIIRGTTVAIKVAIRSLPERSVA